jgi:hypothetical protein
MNQANKAHLLAAQLLAHNLEGVPFPRIKAALELEAKASKAAAIMFKHCIDLAINVGCQEEYEAATDTLYIYYRAMGWDVAKLVHNLNETVGALYMGEEA